MRCEILTLVQKNLILSKSRATVNKHLQQLNVRFKSGYFCLNIKNIYILILAGNNAKLKQHYIQGLLKIKAKLNNFDFFHNKL